MPLELEDGVRELLIPLMEAAKPHESGEAAGTGGSTGAATGAMEGRKATLIPGLDLDALDDLLDLTIRELHSLDRTLEARSQEKVAACKRAEEAYQADLKALEAQMLGTFAIARNMEDRYQKVRQIEL